MQVAGIQDFRQEGPPGDVGTYVLSSTAVGFRFTFSGTTYYAVIQTGIGGWRLIGGPGTDPAVVVNAAFVALGVGGHIILLRAEYTLVATSIAFSASEQTLEGEGKGTFINGDVLPNDVDNIAILSGFDYLTIRKLSLRNVKGVPAKYRACIYQNRAHSHTPNHYLTIEYVVIPQSSDYGILIEGGTGMTGLKILHCTALNCDADGICADNWSGADYFITVLVQGNIVSGCNGGGYMGSITVQSCGDTSTSASGPIITENIILNSGYVSLNCEANEGNCTISYNYLFNGSSTGMYCYNSAVMTNVIGNVVWSMTNNSDGIDIEGISNVMNNICHHNTGNGIFVWSFGGLLDYNHCYNNTGYGLRVNGAEGPIRLGPNNWLRNNTAGAFIITGTEAQIVANVTFPTIVVPFFDGTEAQDSGWLINSAGDMARATILLPASIQQVVATRVYLRSTITEAHKMLCDFNIYGGADNEPYNTHNGSVASQLSYSANFAADDVIFFRITTAGVLALLGGDSVELKAIFRATDQTNCDTGGYFRTVSVEYV